MISIGRAIIELYPGVVNVIGDTAYNADGQIVDYDKAAVEERAYQNQCKDEAKQRITACDWAVLPDVGLKNAADFVTYRGILRGLIISPVVNPDFPIEPTPVWE